MTQLCESLEDDMMLLQRTYHRWMQLLILLAAVSLCVNAQTQTPTPKTQLRVALFPYIPDVADDNNATLLARIEREFESKNPTVDLILRPLDKVNDDFYDPGTLKNWLTTEPANGGYDLVEVDTVLLGLLVSDKLVAQWSTAPPMSDWHPAGRSASSVNGSLYGVPHWLCGHFIFSRDKRVVKVKNVTALLAALDKTNPNVTNLAGDLIGSWNLSALYLDAWADTHGPDGVASAVTPVLDQAVMGPFRLFSKQCEAGGKNPCIDGAFHDNDLSAQQFTEGKADAFLGYSERLNYMMRHGGKPSEIKIESAPLGEGKRPILFVDAFVLRRDCGASCQDAASRFAAYMNAPETQEWVLMGRDKNTDAVPRYLLPATDSAFKAPLVSRNEYFKTLRKEIKGGAPFPVSGLPAAKGDMRDAILKELQK
jgi:thiamine pyridinylase